MKKPALQSKRFGILRMAFRDFRDTSQRRERSLCTLKCSSYDRTVANLCSVETSVLVLASFSRTVLFMHLPYLIMSAYQ